MEGVGRVRDTVAERQPETRQKEEREAARGSEELDRRQRGKSGHAREPCFHLLSAHQPTCILVFSLPSTLPSPPGAFSHVCTAHHFPIPILPESGLVSPCCPEVMFTPSAGHSLPLQSQLSPSSTL